MQKYLILKGTQYRTFPKQTLAPHQDLTQQNLWMNHARINILWRGQFSHAQALLIHFKVILFYSTIGFTIHSASSIHPS